MHLLIGRPHSVASRLWRDGKENERVVIHCNPQIIDRQKGTHFFLAGTNIQIAEEKLKSE